MPSSAWVFSRLLLAESISPVINVFFTCVWVLHFLDGPCNLSICVSNYSIRFMYIRTHHPSHTHTHTCRGPNHSFKYKYSVIIICLFDWRNNCRSRASIFIQVYYFVEFPDIELEHSIIESINIIIPSHLTRDKFDIIYCIQTLAAPATHT